MKNEDLFEKVELYNNLYDLYKNLFTEKQKLYFESYFFSDMSLSEIANENNVSRNAVFLSLKAIQSSLEEYEEKLHLYSKRTVLMNIVSEYENNNNLEIKNIINKIKEMEL